MLAPQAANPPPILKCLVIIKPEYRFQNAPSYGTHKDPVTSSWGPAHCGPQQLTNGKKVESYWANT